MAREMHFASPEYQETRRERGARGRVEFGRAVRPLEQQNPLDRRRQRYKTIYESYIRDIDFIRTPLSEDRVLAHPALPALNADLLVAAAFLVALRGQMSPESQEAAEQRLMSLKFMRTKWGDAVDPQNAEAHNRLRAALYRHVHFLETAVKGRTRAERAKV